MDYKKNYLNIIKNAEGNKYVIDLLERIRTSGLPIPEAEFKFHATRRWRFDLAYVEKKLAIEIDGGGFGRVVVCGKCHSPVMRFRKDGVPYAVREGGAHNTGKGLENNNEKMTEAVLDGWRVLRFTPSQIKSGYATQTICRALQQGQDNTGDVLSVSLHTER